MTQQEFNSINWHRGNVVKLENGKEYFVKGTKGHGKYLLLYSEEFESSFVADYRIVEARTSDYEEPEEVYLEMKRQKRAEAEAKREAERQAARKAKEERKQRNLEAQQKAHMEALARKAAKKNARAKDEPKVEKKPVAAAEPKTVVAPKTAEAPKSVETPKAAEPAPEAPKKRVRQRIRIPSAVPVREKVEFFNKKK